MANVNPAMSVITLSMSGLNNPGKRQKPSD